MAAWPGIEVKTAATVGATDLKELAALTEVRREAVPQLGTQPGEETGYGTQNVGTCV